MNARKFMSAPDAGAEKKRDVGSLSRGPIAVMAIAISLSVMVMCPKSRLTPRKPKSSDNSIADSSRNSSVVACLPNAEMRAKSLPPWGRSQFGMWPAGATF